MKRFKDNELLTGAFLSAGFAMLTLLIVYVIDGFYPLGNGSIIAIDLNAQYTPLLYRFYDVVTGAKHVAMDFHIGGGINLYNDTITELLNPFNYVLLLFKRASIYKAVNVLLLMYVMAAAVTAYVAINKIGFGLHKNAKIALALSYSLSYFVAYQYEIIRWMYIVVLFPLVFLALKKLLEESKPLVFSLLLAYILILSFQFGIQLCIFSFIYSVCYLVNRRKEEDVKHKFLLVGLAFVSALLISAISTVPMVINLMTSARSVQSTSILSVIESHGLDNIFERILEISNPVVVGLLIAAVISYKKQIKTMLGKVKVEWICLLILVLSVIFEPTNLLWHLGSYQCFPVRYAYIIVWLGIVVVASIYGSSENASEQAVQGNFENASEQAVKGSSENAGDTATEDSSVVNRIVALVGVVVTILAGICAFIFATKNSLRFAHAFATLEISKMKKETLLLYVLMFVVIGLTAQVVLLFKKNVRIKESLITYLACVMGAVWFVVVLWPQSFEARSIAEGNYVNQTKQYAFDTVQELSGRVREDDTTSLNACLVSGQFSMSAYVPSGESLEYVTAMQKLGYDTPWISVSEKGGSELSDKWLGIGESNVGARLIDKEEFITLRNIVDLSEIVEGEARTISLNNRKGIITIASDTEMSGVLLLPLAYINGWSSPQGEVVRYLEGFMAVELADKVNEVELKYTLPGFNVGMTMLFLGIVCLALLMILARESESKVVKNLDKFAAACFAVLAVAFAVMVYVLPNIGMFVFMGAKAMGNDLGPYIESKTTKYVESHVLISESVEEDGIHVLIGKNNLMRGKGVKVVSSDDENASFRAVKVADGFIDRENRWSSENNHDNNEHFLQADFGEAKNIQALNIYWERTNASHYYVEISDDGANWKVASEFNNPAMTNPQIVYYEDCLTARYIRIRVDEVTKNEEDLSLYYQNISILELEVYDDKCDSFVVAKPVIEAGENRAVPVMDVPEGYILKVGGINYDNLLTADKKFANNIADVDINLGYELYCGDDKWDLTGFDITLPAYQAKAGEKSIFPYRGVEVREWLPKDGYLDVAEYKNELIGKDNCKIVETSIEPSANYLGNEGYEIDISKNDISIIAKTERGIYWGRVTLAHMVREKEQMPCGTIRDYPEYAVRGFVLDVARRPVPMETLYSMLNVLSDCYMNTFQIHLSDNAIITMSEYDGTVDGARELFSAYRLESDVKAGDKSLTTEEFYYTDKEFKKFIEDAKAIGVDVIPEIDTPAHAMAITSIRPELGYSDNPELADTLDITKPEVLEFATDLWAEYLGKDELFEACDIVHLGMDEFYGNSSDYVNYMSKLSSNIRGMAPDKSQRVWASLTYNDANTSSLNRNIEMMIWNPTWSDPKKTYDDGFKVINCLNKHLYIIVGGGNDRLDVDDLALNWQPNEFIDEDCEVIIPKWSPRMLGACYSMWNDHYCSNEVKDCKDLYERFMEPLEVIAEKLW